MERQQLQDRLDNLVTRRAKLKAELTATEQGIVATKDGIAAKMAGKPVAQNVDDMEKRIVSMGVRIEAMKSAISQLDKDILVAQAAVERQDEQTQNAIDEFMTFYPEQMAATLQASKAFEGFYKHIAENHEALASLVRRLHEGGGGDEYVAARTLMYAWNGIFEDLMSQLKTFRTLDQKYGSRDWKPKAKENGK